MSNPMPADATDLFDKMVPIGIKGYADKIREINACIAFNITGEGGGNWYLDAKNIPPSINRGVSEKADCTIEINHEDFKKCMIDPNAGIELYFEGKVKITGNGDACLKLANFFSITKTNPR